MNGIGTKNGVNYIGIKEGTNQQRTIITHSIEIGNWNIDSIATKEVNHTLTSTELDSIITATAIIKNDTLTTYKPIQVTKIDEVSIYLYCDLKGTDYNNDTINRGTITLLYTPN